MQKYTAEEVAKHSQSDDLWIILHGKVYDASKFYKEHPGGEEVFLDSAGRDATKCFDDIGHSQEAIQLKDSLFIGHLDGESAISDASVQRQPTVDDDDWTYEEPKKESSPYLPLVIGIGVAVYAVIFYYYF